MVVPSRLCGALDRTLGNFVWHIIMSLSLNLSIYKESVCQQNSKVTLHPLCDISPNSMFELSIRFLFFIHYSIMYDLIEFTRGTLNIGGFGFSTLTVISKLIILIICAMCWRT
jgi:hypothetical protein